MPAAEPAVMQTKEWDIKQFTQMGEGVFRREKNHFKDIVETKNEILRPIKKDDRARVPIKTENPHNGNKVGDQ